MRWLFIVILLISANLNAQDISPQLTDSTKSQFKETISDTLHHVNIKSPTKAFILSFVGGATFLPGLGQHYNGEHKKGWYMGAIWFSGWFIAASTVDRNNEKTGQAIGIPLVVTTWVWSCIDALLSAKKINRKHREQNTYGHMLELHEKQLTLGLDLNIYKRTIMPNLTLHF